jgi:hypothetical protein
MQSKIGVNKIPSACRTSLRRKLRDKNRLHAETERQRIQGDVLKAVLSSAPELWKDNNGRLTEVNEQIIVAAKKTIEHIASEMRVTDVLLKEAPRLPRSTDRR